MRSNILITVIIVSLVVYSGFITFSYVSTKNKLVKLELDHSAVVEKLNSEKEQVEILKQSLDQCIFITDSLTNELRNH